jgi:hypothetical protein
MAALALLAAPARLDCDVGNRRSRNSSVAPHLAVRDKLDVDPGRALFCHRFLLYIKSGNGFSAQQLGGLPEVHAGNRDQRLVTDGIRSRLRHPVYAAHLCEMLAWSTGTGLAVCWGLTAFAVITGALMIRVEDAELEKRFGAPYSVYRNNVPALMPRLFHERQL